MFSAIVLLLVLPLYSHITFCQTGVLGVYSSLAKIQYGWFIMIFLILIFLGSNPAAAPYVLSSKIFTICYFLYFLVLVPVTSAKSLFLIKKLI